MAIKITKQTFVTPIEAIQIVGRESFGPNWDTTCVNDRGSPLHETALHNLRAALESGKVTAFFHNFDGEHLLQPYQAAGEFFRINLTEDCIHLTDGVPQQCRINAEQLTAFIRSHATGGPLLTAGAVTQCFSWLVAIMRSHEHIPRKALLFQQAKSKFPGLSRSGFEEARQRAIDATERYDLRAPGRPKTSKI